VEFKVLAPTACHAQERLPRKRKRVIFSYMYRSSIQSAFPSAGLLFAALLLRFAR
jgi:hypothetical protein